MVDIRIDGGFFDHPKTKKLVRRLGLQGMFCLQKLWIWCAKYRPDGELLGMDAEDVALSAEWDGDTTDEEFVQVLLDLRWIEKVENGYRLHGWQERNPWAANADSRAGKARLSKLAQVNPAAYRDFANKGKDSITKEEYLAATCDTTAKPLRSQSVRRAFASDTPAPSPSPSPSPKTAAAGEVDPAIGTAGAYEAATAVQSGHRFPAPEQSNAETLPLESSLFPLSDPDPPPEPPLPDDNGHMHLNEAASMYRQCFPGKQSLQVSPMVLAKLDVLISQYTRDEMLAGFDAVANAGATSLSYLEKALEGKRSDTCGKPRSRPLSRQGEAMNRLAEWAKGDWLREEIAAGVARLIADGKREGMPSADLITVTAENYRDALMPYQLTEEERPRVREMFNLARSHCQTWPQGKELCALLPRRRAQECLPESTHGVPPDIAKHLVDEFLKGRKDEGGEADD